jgi:3-hydroxyacyl-CoA dehydrogenase
LKEAVAWATFYARETDDPSLEPSPLLQRLAAEGKTFASLAKAV